jgi:thiol:disulfide interchange protein DsbA
MSARKTVNIALPLAGLGLIIFYSFCGSSCVFLKGDLLGVDLKYLGAAYALLLPALVLLRREASYIAALSLGIGIEVNLVAFQVRNGTYCPYCLAFAAILVFLFIFNWKRSRLPLMSICAAIGFFLCLILFKGAATPAYADEVLMPTFGTGKVQVRLYTDYFCGPCSRMEPKIEPTLKDLVRRNAVTLTLVDTPIHAHTPLFARYFVYILNADRRFDQVLRSREVLFEAAGQKISERDKLEEFLRAHDVKFKETDPRPTFAALSALMREDKVLSTPTCVIVQDGKKSSFSGDAEIAGALSLLR